MLEGHNLKLQMQKTINLCHFVCSVLNVMKDFGQLTLQGTWY